MCDHVDAIASRLDDFIRHWNNSSEFCNKSHMRLITSATPPFHVEWVSGDWSKALGWSSEEVQGLDCKFLQGDVTDMGKISKFMSSLLNNGGRAELEILNYRKDNVLVRNRLKCTPLVDECGPRNKQKISHIGVTVDIHQIDHLDTFYITELLEVHRSAELGMPLDRRENCKSYDKCCDLPPPSMQEWITLTDNLALALMMRYMLRSQAPILLIDRNNGRIVHVNISWFRLTGHTAVACDGMPLKKFFGSSTSEESLVRFEKYLEECFQCGDKEQCNNHNNAHNNHDHSNSDAHHHRRELPQHGDYHPHQGSCNSHTTSHSYSNNHSSHPQFNHEDVQHGAQTQTQTHVQTQTQTQTQAQVQAHKRRPAPVDPIDIFLTVRSPYYKMSTREVNMTMCPAAVGNAFIAVLLVNNYPSSPSTSSTASSTSTSSSTSSSSSSSHEAKMTSGSVSEKS